MSIDATETLPSIVVATTITKARVSDLLCTAFEGGMVGHWCRIYDYIEPTVVMSFSGERNVCPYTDYPLTDDGAALVYETSDDNDRRVTDGMVKRGEAKTIRLDLASVTRGLALMAEKTPRHFGDFLAGEEDAETGDVFLQLALLGEVKYG
jgi:hypothetical protein